MGRVETKTKSGLLATLLKFLSDNEEGINSEIITTDTEAKEILKKAKIPELTEDIIVKVEEKVAEDSRKALIKNLRKNKGTVNSLKEQPDIEQEEPSRTEGR